MKMLSLFHLDSLADTQTIWLYLDSLRPSRLNLAKGLILFPMQLLDASPGAQLKQNEHFHVSCMISGGL